MTHSKTEEKIKERLKQAKEKYDCWELTTIEYNKFVRHCRKLLTLLKTHHVGS